MKKLTRILALSLVLLFLMGTVSECFASFKAKVISSEMYVFSKTSAKKANVIGSLKKGKTFKVESYSGNWAKISLNGKTGYAKISDMQFSSGKTKYTNCSAAVYKKPGSGKMGTLDKNTKVKVVGWSGSYYLITRGGKTGYIKKSNLSDSYSGFTRYLKSNTVVYKSASTSRPLATIKKGTKVSVKGESGNYYKASVAGKNVYVKKSDVSKSKSSVSSKTMYGKGSYVVHNLPNGSGTITKIKKNQKVKVIGTSGSYYAIANGSRVGYVSKSGLSSSKLSTNTGASLMPSSLRSTQKTYTKGMSASQRIEHAIYYAQSKLGCKYSSSPNNSTTFDCVTLVYYAFKASGVTVKDTTKGIAGMNCKSVLSIGSLKRGDIVCFDTSTCGHCNHVGIYVGSGKFLHASSGGGKVMLSPITSGFYKNCFIGAKRVL